MDEADDQNDLEIQEFNEFNIPDSFLRKLHEFSGPLDGSRGYLLVTISQSGTPVVVSQYDSKIVEMGVRKSLELYLENLLGDDIIYE